ncbi:MAG TPA: TfuA-like protein [Thermoanaerobaculia bacterium]|nr:TfuA-like protein [Thermoanaerobaculia bacterium]
MIEAIVFAGPCLAGQRLEGFELRPPAQRGDILAALAQRPHTLVLLDGYYYTVGSVTHKELLYALDSGVRVIGASSMGALRAVEMEPFGMIGVGRVFSWYRDGTLDGDDEVAILHAPAEMGYRPMTVALVEVRAALEDENGAGRLIEALKELPFTERSLRRILDLAGELLGDRGRDLLARRLAAHSVKREDAEKALALARQAPPLAASRRSRRAVDHFSFDRERYMKEGENPSLAEVWGVAQVLHPEAPALVKDLRVRFLLSTAALEEGLEVEETGIAEPGAAMPWGEVLEEARFLALSEAARSHFGGVEAALQSLARQLGASPGNLLEALDGRAGFLPVWWMARAFAFSPAFPAALATARAAIAIRDQFLAWSEGAPIRHAQLQSLAERLWGSADVGREAARRGLLDFHGRSLGFYEALALLAPAELLKRPVHEYVRCRDELLSFRLQPHQLHQQ